MLRITIEVEADGVVVEVEGGATVGVEVAVGLVAEPEAVVVEETEVPESLKNINPRL